MKNKLLLGLLLIFVISCASHNKKLIDQLNFETKELTLDNGLSVLLVKNPKLPVFSLYTYYDVGAKYEKKGITGASHFLEHLMFKGAKKYGPGEFDRYVEGSGGRNNAYTSRDLTVYYENLPKKALERMIDIEADRMVHLLLEPKSFEKERFVILEERKMRYENSDGGKLSLKMFSEVFKGTPYGISAIGEIPDLKSVSRDQIYEYFKKFYAPNNAFMIITGDIDFDETTGHINKYFSSLKRSETLASMKKRGDAPNSYKWREDFKGETHLKGTNPLLKFQIAFQSVSVKENDAYALDILSNILGGGKSSYLNQNYVEAKESKFNSIYAANYTLMNSGVFFIGGSYKAKTGFIKSKDEVLKSIKSVCENKITSKDVTKIKNNYLVRTFAGLDTNAGIASFLGDRKAYYGDYFYYKKEFSEYEKVSVNDVKRVCEKYLTTRPSMVFTIWNQNKGI